ncbi:hypothetical protein HAZT_HAZT010060 [Hyalella azteca]|uniref:Uncharacterized protein n=1 Tax=Hyalella azteca TaxID=294128 RepID=A0A6A0H067_HYAAZ|nr:hypothetical protein HAZT_HAZT010060 [Hyalella azteca]
MARKCPDGVSLDGKTVIVTGASAGIGKATTLELAKRGARVIMACRSLAKAQPIADDIISKSGNTNVVVRHLELSDFASVRKFAAQINAEEEALHILINNAGIAGTKNKEVASCGHELVLATNHYGHFLLTHLLMGKLKAGTSSRVINVSSALHADGQLDIEDLNFDRRRYRFEHAESQRRVTEEKDRAL